MPQIAEIKEIDGEVWVRIGKLENHESGIAIWTPKEQEEYKELHYGMGYEDGQADAECD